MIAGAAQLNRLSLQNLYIDKNKAAAEALREKKPHQELVYQFREVKELLPSFAPAEVASTLIWLLP
jgi:hypothetical protein